MKFRIIHPESDADFIEEYNSIEDAFETYKNMDIRIEEYKMDIAIEEKIRLVKELLLSVERDGMKELVEWADREGFFEAPASSIYHGNYKHGLLLHSINVYNAYVKLCKEYGIKVSRDSKIIVAFGHDFCKIKLYIESNNKYKPYNVDYNVYNQGHGKLSVERIEKFIKLTDFEKTAIKCHMGTYTKDIEQKELFGGFNDFAVKLLYFADEISTNVLEIENDKNKNN